MQIEIGENLAGAIALVAAAVAICVFFWLASRSACDTRRPTIKPKIPRDPPMWTWEEKKTTRKEKNDEVD